MQLQIIIWSTFKLFYNTHAGGYKRFVESLKYLGKPNHVILLINQANQVFMYKNSFVVIL